MKRKCPFCIGGNTEAYIDRTTKQQMSTGYKRCTECAGDGNADSRTVFLDAGTVQSCRIAVEGRNEYLALQLLSNIVDNL